MKISHETKRAKKIIVELVRQAGGQFQNKTNLFKAFWKAHLAYAANQPGYLSTWPIVRMPNGPGIDDFDTLLSEMLADGWLTIDEVPIGNFRAMVFKLGQNCPPPRSPPARSKPSKPASKPWTASRPPPSATTPTANPASGAKPKTARSWISTSI